MVEYFYGKSILIEIIWNRSKGTSDFVVGLPSSKSRVFSMRERRREARDEFKGRRGCTVNGMISVDPSQFSRAVTLQRRRPRVDAWWRPTQGRTACAAAVYKYFANFSTRSRRSRQHFSRDSSRSLLAKWRARRPHVAERMRENDFEIAFRPARRLAAMLRHAGYSYLRRRV